MNQHSKAADQENVRLTVYQNGFASILEERTVEKNSRIWMDDLPDTMEKDSFHLKNAAVTSITFPEREMDPQRTLLAQSIGRTVYVRKDNRETACRLLHADPVIVQEEESGLVVVSPEGEMAFTDVPDFSRNGALVHFSTAPEQPVLLSYVAGGFSWHPVYRLTVADESLHLESSLMLHNASGTSFRNIELHAMAGEAAHTTQHSRAMMLMESAPEPIETIPEGELYRLTIPSISALNDGESVMLPYRTQTGLTYETLYLADRHHRHPEVLYRWTHEGNEPLLSGKVRLYRPNGAYTGDATMPFTSPGEKAELVSGRAVNVTVVHTRLQNRQSGRQTNETHRYELSNHHDKAIQVMIRHDVYEQDWELLDYTGEVIEQTDRTIQLAVDVEPGETEYIRLLIAVRKPPHDSK